MKYPLPTRKATDNRIGKGGNGFVFTIIHARREYAVKKVGAVWYIWGYFQHPVNNTANRK